MEEDWETTKRLDNPVLYGQFVRKYPDSPHVAEARQRSDDVVERIFVRTKATHTREAYQRFIELFPTDRRAKDAERVLEDLWWAETKSATDRPALLAYLRQYPQGRYVAEGRPAYERLRAAALADSSWESGRAAQGCAWLCRGVDCITAGVSEALQRKVLAYANAKIDGVPVGTLYQHVANDVLPDGKIVHCQVSRRSGAGAVHFTMCQQLDSPVSVTYDGLGTRAVESRRAVIEPSQIPAWQRECT